MNDDTVLLRQVHPNFAPNGALTSQAFIPFPKDRGRLSVYDGDMISAARAYQHYTLELGNQSCGVWGVSCAEVREAGLTSLSDPLPDFSAHALIDFGAASDKECRKLAKRLKAAAVNRGCLYDGTI